MFFVNQKTEYQLKICFCLLVSRRTAMVLNNEAKMLIKNLYLFKNYSARKLTKEFPENGWKLRTLNYFLKEAA